MSVAVVDAVVAWVVRPSVVYGHGVVRGGRWTVGGVQAEPVVLGGLSGSSVVVLSGLSGCPCSGG